MNQKILSKCLEELAKPAPDLGYLRGMIEVLHASVEVSAPAKPVYSTTTPVFEPKPTLQATALTEAEKTIQALTDRSKIQVTQS